MEDSAICATNKKIQRITILFSEISGYILACWQELKTRHNIELQVFYWKPVRDAPFDVCRLDWIDHCYSREGYDALQISRMVEEFGPQGIYIPGWMDSGYLRVAKKFKQKGIPVVSGLDGQWIGNLRQRLGSFAAPYYLHPAIDVLWVTGDRQAQFAKKLGYTGAKCWYGLYCCDWEKFARLPPGGDETNTGDEKNTNVFLFVGRYVPVKGVEELLAAYRLYRARVEQPWPLLCAGAGPMQRLVNAHEGIRDVGFLQPGSLPALMHNQAGAFILPSRQEPWGVVLQEAAASGLPLICSDACGAAVHLLQDGYNGFLFEAGNAAHLADCLIRLHKTTAAERVEMGRRSHEFSKQFTPQRWATTFVEGLRNLQEVKNTG